MANENSRTHRVADQMQRELAILVQRDIRDPRVGMITVTAVDVSRDLAHAKVYITLMDKDSDEDIAQNLSILKAWPAFCACSWARS